MDPTDSRDLVDDMELDLYAERRDDADAEIERLFIRTELRAIERDLGVPLLVEWVR